MDVSYCQWPARQCKSGREAVEAASYAARRLLVPLRLGEQFGRLVREAYTDYAQTINAGMAVATAVQVNNGLGRHADTLSDMERTTFERVSSDATLKACKKLTLYLKCRLALDSLFACSLACSKLVILVFLLTVAHDDKRRIIILRSAAFVIVWTLLSVLVFGFQCGTDLSISFSRDRCIDVVRRPRVFNMGLTAHTNSLPSGSFMSLWILC